MQNLIPALAILFAMQLISIAFTCFLIYRLFIVKKKPKKRKQAPYVISLRNDTAVIKQGVLFGYNENHDAANYGNPLGVNVFLNNGMPYARMLSQSAGTIAIDKMYIHCKNPEQLSQPLILHATDADNKKYQVPIAPDAHFFNTKHPKTVKITNPPDIDANRKYVFLLLPGARVEVSIYPKPRL